MFARHELEASKLSSFTVDLVIKSCPVETVPADPASAHTFASSAASRRCATSWSHFCARSPWAKVSRVVFGEV